MVSVVEQNRGEEDLPPGERSRSVAGYLGLPVPNLKATETEPPVETGLLERYIDRELSIEERRRVFDCVLRYPSWATELLAMELERYRQAERLPRIDVRGLLGSSDLRHRT